MVSALSQTFPRALPAPAAVAPAPAPQQQGPQDSSTIGTSSTPPQDTLFSFNPQDRRVMEPGTKLIPQVSQGNKGPETSLVQLNDRLQPNEDGSYIFSSEDPRQNAAVTFAGVANTVNVFREVFGDFKWSFKYDKLAINANGGKDFNAFYTQRNGTVNFFAEDDPIFGRPVFSGASGEIVAHETGHAILDAIRPEYFGAWRSDVGAFHESFGDMLALHMSLTDERVVKRVVVQTGGDLSKPNIAAAMAEELAQGLNNKKGKQSTGGDFLRNALNQFTWAEPKSLPEKGGPDQLGWEIHSFSRLWTGAHYELLSNMVAQRLQEGAKPDQALRESNQELLRMLAGLVKEAPRGDFTFKDMAIAFIKSDKIHGQGKHAALIQEVFTRRKILPEDLNPELLEVGNSRLFHSQEEDPVQHITTQLGDGFGQFSGARVEVPVSRERALFKSDEIASETQDQVGRLIAAGKIRYTNPWEQLRFPDDYFNPQGEAYMGVVRWEDGQMKIERTGIAH